MTENRKNGNDKKAKTAEIFERFKEEIANNISHELRTPLTILLCALELAEIAYEENDMEEFKRLLMVAKRSAEMQVEVIQNFCNLLSVKKMNLYYDGEETENFLTKEIK